MTQITRDSLKGEAAATGKRARPRTRTRSISRTRTKKRTTSLVVLALLSAIGAASVAVDAAASTAATAVPRSRSKFHSNSNSNVYHNSNSNFDSNSNLNLKLASPSFYSPQNKVVITKSSEQLELEQRLHRLKGDADDSDDDDDRQQHQQEFITSFYRRKREEHLKTTTAGRANAYDEFGNRRRRRDRREGSQTSLCSIHQSAAVRGGAVRSASASSSISSTALFGGLGQDRGQDRRGQGLCDQDRGQDRRDLHHRPRSKHASDASKSASSPSHTQSSATARRDAQFPEDLDSTYDGNDGDDDDDNSGGDYFPSSLSGDDNVDNNGSTSASSTDGGGGLGLLRVPCSIAINSNEDARSHPHHSHSHHHHLDHSHHRHHGVGNHGLGHSSSHSHDHHVKKTPIAAYVDTGAQVTVISASAARRAGILHLMDRRYAGRATGVGHCKVLGRIPARHVYFILGDGGDTAHGKADVKCHWDDPHGEDDYRDDGHNYSEDSSTVQMEGPALTVLEGTVTQGVDVLLGLDVLQDWEAEIRMGPNKSITVRKRHGRTGSGGGSANTDVAITDKLVIPFVNENYGDRNGCLSHSSRRRRHQHLSHRGGHDRRAPSVAPPENHHSKASLHHPSATSRSRGVDHTHGNYGMSRRHDHSRHHHHHPDHHHGHHPSLSLEDEEQEQEAEDDDFSPTASDVESDLDMLEHSFTTCKTASATILGRASTTPTSSSESNLGRGSLDERLFEEDADNDDNVNYDDDDDYLQEDDDLVDEDDLGDFDMSGL